MLLFAPWPRASCWSGCPRSSTGSTTSSTPTRSSPAAPARRSRPRARELAATATDLAVDAQVAGLEKANLVLVLVIAQAVQVLLLVGRGLAFFMVFGSVAIDDDVIDRWIGEPARLPGWPATRQRPAGPGLDLPRCVLRALLHRLRRHRRDVPRSSSSPRSCASSSARSACARSTASSGTCRPRTAGPLSPRRGPARPARRCCRRRPGRRRRPRRCRRTSRPGS